jgi:hypothetical protein
MTTSKTVIVPVEVLTQAREALRDWEIREKRYAAIERIDALLAAPAPDAALSDAGKGDELGNILAAIRDHAHAQLDVVGANLAQQALSAYAAPLEREDATERELFEQRGAALFGPMFEAMKGTFWLFWQEARASISPTPSYTTPNGYSFSRNHDGDELLLKDGKVVGVVREMVGKGKAAGCTRSHPHEDMNAECQAKTEAARKANAATHPVGYLVDGRVEQGLFFDKASADAMAEVNCGTVVPLGRIPISTAQPECQYAKDVSMPEYRCVGKCQYARPAGCDRDAVWNAALAAAAKACWKPPADHRSAWDRGLGDYAEGHEAACKECAESVLALQSKAETADGPSGQAG